MIRKEDVCISGARVTLIDAITGNKTVTNTETFGGFWFKDLKGKNYSIKIEAAGFPTKAIENINAARDVNLGDSGCTGMFQVMMCPLLKAQRSSITTR